MSISNILYYGGFMAARIFSFLCLTIILASTSLYISIVDNVWIFELNHQEIQTAWAQTSEDLFPNATSSALLGNRSIIPGMHVMSLMNDVKPTWLIISSDNELSVNIRYTGSNITTPAVSLLATGLKTVANAPSPQIPRGGTFERLTGTNVTQAGWISPTTVPIQLQGTSSLYDSDLIVVMIVPYTGAPLLANSTSSNITGYDTNSNITASTTGDTTVT
ncbi:MAG TPA: hypothetical protein VH415_09135 [Nitrososphaeraceae archaeon]